MATAFDPSAILAQMTEGYLKLPLAQKIIYPLLIIGSVMGIVMISKWANRPDYGVLYSELESADAASVVEHLKSQKVKYEIRGDGGTIAITPASMVHEVRMSLASEGLPKGGAVGLEIFEVANLGATTFQEKVKFQRAIQGELERTISSLDGIQSVRVHVTQPERSVFAKRGSPPTASVMLKLRGETDLEKKQIKGIAHLVAGSVEGLNKENVSIVDVYGNLLYPTEEEEQGLAGESTRIGFQHDIERSYVQRVEQMLTKVLGPGKGVARVTAEMDFSSNEREEESYDPGGQVLRSQRSVEEGDAQAQRGGVPGVSTNLSNDPNLLSPGSGTGSNSNRKEEIKNFEVSRAVTKTSQPRGKLLKLSVAVLVDGTYDLVPAATPEAEPTKVFKPLSADTMAQIENVVKSAVGFDSARGDVVTVENIPFFEPDSTIAEALDSKATQDLIFNTVFKGAPILFMLLFFFIVVRPLVKFLVTPTEAELDLERLLPTGIQELEKELEAERRAAVPDYEPSVDLEQLEEVMAENSRVVRENPQQAALLIRYWLNDGRL